MKIKNKMSDFEINEWSLNIEKIKLAAVHNNLSVIKVNAFVSSK